MTWWESIILGTLQGLTEFLPVSSSGHLEIGQTLFGSTGEDNLLFAVVVHAATVLSTITILWAEIWALMKGCFTKTWNPEKEYIAKIAVSMIPIFVVGIFFKDQVESFFGQGLLLVGCCLVITSLLLAFAYFAKPRVREKISYRDALAWRKHVLFYPVYRVREAPSLPVCYWAIKKNPLHNFRS